MSLLEKYFDFEKAFEEVRETNLGCLSDCEPKIRGLTVKEAEKFLKEMPYSFQKGESYIKGNRITFVFGEEYFSGGETNVCEDYINVTVIVADDMIEWIICDQ